MSMNSPISDQEIQRGIISYFDKINIRNLDKLYIASLMNDVREKMEEVTFTYQDTREDKIRVTIDYIRRGREHGRRKLHNNRA